jgi:zinc protease
MKGWVILAMSLFFTASLPTKAGIFNAETTTLPNGLQVVLIPNHLAPIVSVCLVYKVGTADDPVELYGLSHFLEHLMFKGTKEVPADQFKKIISRNGGSINAFTSPDITGYTCDIAVEFLDSYLKLEADRMQNLVMEPQEVLAEQKVVLEERLMRLDNNPFGVAYEASLRATYWYHPYGIPAIGYPQHISAYTRDAAYEHYKKWYAPNNAILIVAGDVTLETLKPMVEKYFGCIPSHPLPPRVRIAEPDHKGVTITLEQENPRSSQVNIDWNYAAPNHRGANSRHYYPLIVLAQALGGNEISRFHRSLVEKQKIAVSATCSYDSDGYDPQTFSFSVTLAPNADLITLKKEVGNLIQDVLNKGITNEELENAKRDVLASLAFARDGNSSSVMAFTRLAIGFTVEQIENWPNEINAVTSDQIHKAAKFVLSQNPVTVAAVYPDRYKEKNNQKEMQHALKSHEEENKQTDNVPGKDNIHEKNDLKNNAQK